MSRRAAGLAACAFAIGYPIGYALPAYAHLVNLYYDPVARRFLLGLRPGPVPMGYYGQIVYGGAVGLACAAVTYLVARRSLASERALGLATAWALTALVLVAAYFTWNNWP